MSRDICLGLSYAALAGTGIYCIVKLNDHNIICPNVTYGVLIVNNILGVVSWAQDVNTGALPDLFKVTSYAQLLFALPCINSQIWLDNGYSKEISYMWSIIPLIPFVLYLVQSEIDLSFMEIMLLLNLIGMGVVSFNKKNNYGIAATIAYAISHLCLQHRSFYNLGLCFFAYFSLRALGHGEDLV